MARRAALCPLLAALLALWCCPASAAPILPQYGLITAQDIWGDMCPASGKSTMFPLRTPEACAALGLRNATESACSVMELLQVMLSSRFSAPLKCTPDVVAAPRDVDPAGFPVPQPLPDLRRLAGGRALPSPVPAAAAAALLELEGPSYAWLYSHVLRLAAWAACPVLGESVAWQPPPGWALVSLAGIANDLRGYDLPADSSLPAMAVLRRASSSESQAACRAWHERAAPVLRRVAGLVGGSARAAREAAAAAACGPGDHLLVLIRGTASAPEWASNFDMSLRPEPAYGAGLLHSGFLGVAQQLWDGAAGLRRVLDDAVVARAAGAVASLTLSGHSLGGAMASMLAARAEAYLAAKLPPGAPRPALSVVNFASPNVGDAAFAGSFGARVNARLLAFESDLVPQLPCSGGMLRCPAGGGGASAAARAARAGPWPYAQLGGVLRLEAAAMPFQRDVWARLNTYHQDEFCDNVLSVSLMARATHLCSYLCALSPRLQPGSVNNMCKLWPDRSPAEAAGATFCMAGRDDSFPSDPLYPSNLHR